MDFTYRVDGLWVTILPESPQAEQVWNDQIGPKTEGTGKVLLLHWPEVKAQLKAAGYAVRKARQTKGPDDQELLASLQ